MKSRKYSMLAHPDSIQQKLYPNCGHLCQHRYSIYQILINCTLKLILYMRSLAERLYDPIRVYPDLKEI